MRQQIKKKIVSEIQCFIFDLLLLFSSCFVFFNVSFSSLFILTFNKISLCWSFTVSLWFLFSFAHWKNMMRKYEIDSTDRLCQNTSEIGHLFFCFVRFRIFHLISHSHSHRFADTRLRALTQSKLTASRTNERSEWVSKTMISPERSFCFVFRFFFYFTRYDDNTMDVSRQRHTHNRRWSKRRNNAKKRKSDSKLNNQMISCCLNAQKTDESIHFDAK